MMIPTSYQPIVSDSPSENSDNHDDELEDSQHSTWRRAIQRVRKIDKSFVVSKAFYFFFYTALGSLFPFFSLYYKQLWLTPGQIGLLLALRPAVKLVCLPLWKMVTDRFSRPKVVYFISIFGWIIGYYGQSFVFPTNTPCYGYATETPATQEIAFSTPASNLHSTTKSSNITTRELTLNKHLSAFVQKWDQESYQELSKIKKTEVNLFDNTIKSEKIFKDASSKPKRITRSQLNGHYANNDTDVRSKKTSFVPRSKSTFNLYPLEDVSIEDSSQVIKEPQNDNPREKHLLVSDSAQGNFVTKHKDDELRPYETWNTITRSPRPNEDFRVKYNTWVFRTLILIVILTEIITTPTPMLADNAIVRSLVETDSEYGKQRLFGSLGLSLAAILVAVWVSLETDCVHTDTINYVPCFHLFEIAIGATILVSLCVEFNRPLEENPNEYDIKDAIKLFKNFKNGVFLVTLFLFGFFHSLQNSFLFWYLQDLGGTPSLFSVILLIYCLAEVVMYFISGSVGEAIGQQGIICLAFACYTARYLMYSYLKDPWLVIPMEMAQGITYGGVWSIAAVYVNAPPEATPMVQSILHGSYWGLGMALGSGISGVIIDFTSPRSMFLIAAGICFLLCMFHLGIDIYNKMNDLEAEQAQRLAAQRGEAKPSKSHESSFIGAAAAPLVPCLLYGR